jgi:hypothetical protein
MATVIMTPNAEQGGSSSSVSTLVPFLTLQDVQEWASLGPPIREKPSSEEQLQVQKERKQKRTGMKKQLLLLNGGEKAESATFRKVSAKTLELELDRLSLARVWEPSTDDRPDFQKDNAHPDNTVDCRSEGGPLLQYMWAPPDDPIQGQSMYLGGEVGSDGNIYCIPGHASRVLQIDTTKNRIQPIGPVLTTSDKNGNQRLFKWLRGIVVGDIIYGLPCHADEILRINARTHEITKISIPYDAFYTDPVEAKAQRDMIWKYHGGDICPIDNCIYAVPQRAHHVLKFDPTTETVSFVGPALPGHYKWYGGIVGKSDGAIYCIPQNASGVLRISPTGVTVHGDYGAGNHKWHGGAAAENGVIVSGKKEDARISRNGYLLLALTMIHVRAFLLIKYYALDSPCQRRHGSLHYPSYHPFGRSTAGGTWKLFLHSKWPPP